MRIPSIFVAAMIVSQMLGFGTPSKAQKDKLPHLPRATLLMGWPPYSLELTTGNRILKLQDDGDDWLITPSISTDGRIIATARLPKGELATVRALSTLVISTYSTTNDGWTEYKNLTTFSGLVAISPDGSKLACFTGSKDSSGWRFRIIDIKSGSAKTILTRSLSVPWISQITWSPNGRRIAIDQEVNRTVGVADSSGWSKSTVISKIYLMNLATGAVKEIAEGWLPSWSPSGEWIAYFDYPPLKHNWWPMNLMVPERINIIRPDGTDSKVVGSWSAPWDDLVVAPVWSPDSKTILINRVRDEGDNMDIYLLDLTTGKMTKKFKKSPPVYAWVAAR